MSLFEQPIRETDKQPRTPRKYRKRPGGDATQKKADRESGLPFLREPRGRREAPKLGGHQAPLRLRLLL
jgi:hypothetical protein